LFRYDPKKNMSAVHAVATRPLRVLVVDDEELARMRLKSMVAECAEPRCIVAGEAANAAQALVWLTTHECDLVLLDVQMPGRDGTQLAAELRQRAKPPAIVFVTAHAEHALQAFELEAVDYLTKPVRRERLQAALLRVAQRLQPRGSAAAPMLVVTDRGRVLRIPASDVLYLKAELKYVTLRTADGEWVLDEPLGDLEQRLGDAFIRVHRNALVARRAVRALERHANAPSPGDAADSSAKATSSQEEPIGWTVVLTNGEQLSVSRRQLTSVREALGSAGT